MATKKQVGGYILDKKIGKGSFAEVWRGKVEATGELVAVKVISRSTVQETAQLKQEVAVLKKLSSPHIVRFRDLKKFIESDGRTSNDITSSGPITESLGRLFLRQLASGLSVLHRHNFIHRDLKPQNILLINESPPVLRIADFGFSRALLYRKRKRIRNDHFIQPQDMAATICGSPLYMAPEILQHQKYDSKADLWSVGAILYECFCGSPPFTGPNPMQLLANIEAAPTLPFPHNCGLSPDGKNFLALLLEKDPVKRLPANSFMHHPYVAGDLDLEQCKFSTKFIPDDGVFIEKKAAGSTSTTREQNEKGPLENRSKGSGTSGGLERAADVERDRLQESGLMPRTKDSFVLVGEKKEDAQIIQPEASSASATDVPGSAAASPDPASTTAVGLGTAAAALPTPVAVAAPPPIAGESIEHVSEAKTNAALGPPAPRQHVAQASFLDPETVSNVKRVVYFFGFLGELYVKSRQPAEALACLLEAFRLVEFYEQNYYTTTQSAVSVGAGRGELDLSGLASPRSGTILAAAGVAATDVVNNRVETTNAVLLQSEYAYVSECLAKFDEAFPAGVKNLSLQKQHPGKLLAKYALGKASELVQQHVEQGAQGRDADPSRGPRVEDPQELHLAARLEQFQRILD